MTWFSLLPIIKTEWESNPHIIVSFYHTTLQTDKMQSCADNKLCVGWLFCLHLLLWFLFPSLQSIITSSGSNLSTRRRGSSPLSPSPSLEQRRRAETSTSPCEYCITSQADITPHLCSVYSVFDTCNMQLGSQLVKGQLAHMEKTPAPAWKRTINGNDGVNNLLKTPFPDNCVMLHVLCTKEPQENQCKQKWSHVLSCFRCSASQKGALLCNKDLWQPVAGHII